LDIMPTVVALAGGQPPTDRIIDGKDIGPILRGDKTRRTRTRRFSTSAMGI
jgi:arylsulfatase A-like enzyme